MPVATYGWNWLVAALDSWVIVCLSWASVRLVMFVVGYDVDACGGVSVIVEGSLAGSGSSKRRVLRNAHAA